MFTAERDAKREREALGEGLGCWVLVRHVCQSSGLQVSLLAVSDGRLGGCAPTDARYQSDGRTPGCLWIVHWNR